MNPDRAVVSIANPKGGVGKSLLSAEILECLAQGAATPWTMVEIEHRSSFTQQLYRHPPGTAVLPIALLALNENVNRTEPSLTPMDALWDLIPAEADQDKPSRILVDFGASAFQSFLMWGIERRGLQPFRKAGYQFIFFIPVQASDCECAEFFNMNMQILAKLGKVVLVKNLREGSDFSMINPALLGQVPTITLMHRGNPVTAELQQDGRRLTFRQLAACPNASRRARLDAEECADAFASQLQALRPQLGL